MVAGLLLGSIVFCGLAGLEAWPLTGWRLFSERRQATQAGWSAIEVSPDGVETPVDFVRLGRGFTGALHVMVRFPAMGAGERDEVCGSWLNALRAGRRSAASAPQAVRVYRTTSVLGADHEPMVLQRTLAHECR